MITGWGNYIQRNYKANIYYPKELNSLKNLLSKKGLKSLSIRGNGRSYGDSSINKNIGRNNYKFVDSLLKVSQIN